MKKPPFRRVRKGDFFVKIVRFSAFFQEKIVRFSAESGKIVRFSAFFQEKIVRFSAESCIFAAKTKINEYGRKSF